MGRRRPAGLRRSLAQRVLPVVGDMADLDQSPACFDLIWSGGALYSIGTGKALGLCHGLLRPGGRLVFSDAVWRKDNPPPEVKAIIDADYPAMGTVADVLANIGRSRSSVVGHFTLPDEAWREDFHTPMETRIEELRGKYSADTEALAVFDQIAQEPAMHRRHSAYCAYGFFVLLRADELARPRASHRWAFECTAHRDGRRKDRQRFTGNVASSVNAVHLATGIDTGCCISPLARGQGQRPWRGEQGARSPWR